MGSTTKRQSSGWIPLDGGVDEYHEPSKIDKSRKLYCKNAHINGGILGYRPGRRLWGPVFDYAFDGVHEYVDKSGVSHLLVASAGIVYEVTSSGKTEIDTGLGDETLHFHTYRGRAYYNGATTQRKIVDSTASRIGVVAPTAAPVLTETSTGLTGNYGYKFTYVVEVDGVPQFESNPSPGASINVTNKKVSVVCSASSDTRVNARYVYRTTAGGALYMYVGRIADNVAATAFVDDVADANLGDLLESNHGVPVQAFITEGASERIFGLTSDGRLTHSEQAATDPYLEYQQTVDFYHWLPQGGAGSGLKRLYNSNTARDDLYVFQSGSVHVLPGADPNQPLVTLSNAKGCVQHDTIAEYNGSIVFMSGKDTVEYLSGGRIVDISSRNIPVSLKALLVKNECRATIIYDKYYVLTSRSSQGLLYKNVTWVCDLSTIEEVQVGMADATWFQWDINAAYFLRRTDGTVLAFDDSSKRIFSLSFDVNDDESDAGGTYTAIPVSFQTGDFSFGLFTRFRPSVLKIKGEQSTELTITAHYGSEYRNSSKSSVITPVSAVPFVMGRSTMGSPMTVIANVMSTGIPITVAGVWCGFAFLKDKKDLFFNMSGFEFTYTKINKE